jgi:hypothetical protein
VVKTIGLRKLRYRGGLLVNQIFNLAAGTYNLIWQRQPLVQPA